MLTANTSKTLPEELELLSRAVEGDTFHFVVVQWGHYSHIQRTKDHLRQQYPERPALSLRAKGQTYEGLMEPIYQQGGGFVFFDDFEHLLDNPDLCVAFNQRRGKLARLPLSVVCFIPPGARYVELCIRRLPDWWSVLTFLLELTDDVAENNGSGLKSHQFQEIINSSTLGGPQQQERVDEIQRLQKRLSEISVESQNAKLLDALFSSLLELCRTAGLYQLGLAAANEWLKIAFGLEYEKTAPATYSTILDRIGTFEKYLGHFDRAARLLETALAANLKHYGPDHPTVAISQSNLATVYQSLGDYVRARDLLETALASALKHYGPDHPAVAVRQSNLANVYQDLGDYVRARDLLETALAANLKHYGPD
ncbi:MAG: tetratricopeptide repeat protein, partial [Cytophagaceae bacterium]|nr:tetratricopeptide repeat protein [Cytophagaceae bacterium]